MVQHSLWYHHLYLVSVFALAGVATGYSAMMSWIFGESFNYDQYTAGFALITAFSGILMIWTAISIIHFFRYPNPTLKMARAFVVGSLAIHIAIAIISIVMLGILGPESTMAFYVVLTIWTAINAVLAVLSLVKSPISVQTERRPNPTNVPNMTVRSEEVVIVQQLS